MATDDGGRPAAAGRLGPVDSVYPHQTVRGVIGLVDEVDLETSVADWAIERPEAAGVFERLGIDYSCAGKSLRYACRERGLDPQEVLRQLDHAAGAGRERPPGE